MDVQIGPLLSADAVAILSQAVGGTARSTRSAARVARLLRQDSTLTGWEQEVLVAVACLQVQDGVGRLEAIAVDPSRWGRGYGRQLLDALPRCFALRQVSAQTDGDAVEFYRKCGFNVVSSGESHPGIVRYECTLDTD